MGTTRFLIPVLTALAASVSFAGSTKMKDASVDVNETFATGGDIKAWAAKSFFGGARTSEFSRDGNDLVLVNGMPTSGMITSQLYVYGRAKGEPNYRQLLITSVIYANITPRRTPAEWFSASTTGSS